MADKKVIMKFAPPTGKKEVNFASNPGVKLNNKNAPIKFAQPVGTKNVSFYAADSSKKESKIIKF